MNNLEYYLKAVKYYSPGSLFFRLKYAMLLKSSFFAKRFPQFSWGSCSLNELLVNDVSVDAVSYKDEFVCEKQDKFFFDPSMFSSFELSNKDEVISQADAIVGGKVKYFSKLAAQFDDVPNWFENPFTGQKVKPTDHWTKIGSFSSEQGDIKFIWEPSRFAWVYPLIRAYAVTSDRKYAEHFWKWFEDWLDKNPPNTGPNYKCGQECAIRCFAVCFGIFAFIDCPESTPERIAFAVTMLAVHADRIEKNINYARYQNNNHAISEANGLYTIGTVFPELKNARRWRALGKKVLEECAVKQIAEDGSYVQNSMNYHRLMLDNYLWAIRLAQINGDTFSEKLLSRVNKAFEFLYQLQDIESGRVPNYGANDGALLFPLNSNDYLDYRPILGAMSYLLRGKKLYKSGPWDEKLFWFFGSDAVYSETEPIEQKSTNFSSGGYYTLRSKDSWAFTRCHTFKNRPSHADMLLVDLWYKGINILRDGGSYQYNCAPLWQNYFNSTAAHNCVTIDRLDQMAKGTRFMWFDWTKSKTVLFKQFSNDQVKLFQGEHYGYCRDGRNVVCRRAILLIDRMWVIVDDIIGKGEHDVEVLWRLANGDTDILKNSITLKTNKGPVSLSMMCSDETMQCQSLKGDTEIPAGWESLHYGVREPATSFAMTGRANLPLRVVTLVCTDDIPKQANLSDPDTISWTLAQSQQRYVVALNSVSNSDNDTFVFIKHNSNKLYLNSL